MEPSRRSTHRTVAAVVVGVGVIGFTTTAVSVGTRGMATELSLSVVELGWVVNAYLVAAASLVLIGARLGDDLGRVSTFSAGLVIFAAGSVLGAVAGGFTLLIVARVVQGMGAALVLPASIELITEFSPPGRETLGFRWRGLVYACSFAVGPLVAGAITDFFSWRWIFVGSAAVALAALVLALPLRGAVGRGAHQPTRDVTGAVLVAALIAAVVLLAERLATWGLVSIPWLSLLAAALVLAGLLARHERRTEHRLVHASLLEDRLVVGANVATIGASLGMLSLLYFFNLFAQSAATFDAGAVSVLLALVPFVASMLACALFAHWLGGRLGPRGPAVVGLSLMVVGFALLALTSAATDKSELALPLVLTGIGAGIANASLTGVAVLHLPAGRINEAAGWLSLSRFLGSAMALALGTAAFLSVTAVVPASGAAPASATAPAASAFDVAVANLDRDLSGPAMAAADETSAARFARTMGVTAVVLLVITVVAGILLRPKRDEVDAARSTPGASR